MVWQYAQFRSTTLIYKSKLFFYNRSNIDVFYCNHKTYFIFPPSAPQNKMLIANYFGNVALFCGVLDDICYIEYDYVFLKLLYMVTLRVCNGVQR